MCSLLYILLLSFRPGMLSSLELDPDQLPPLDANGIPKYKGRKRGRKPKIRKRKSNPNRRKRQHTAYTLFVKEVYPSVKAQHSDFPNKEMISIVAKQWALVLPEDKLKWKARAQLTHDSADEDEEEDEEEEEEEAEEDGKDKYGARALNLQAAVAAAATAAAVEAGFGQVDSYGVEGVEDDEEDDDEDEDDEPPPPRRQGHLPTKRK